MKNVHLLTIVVVLVLAGCGGRGAGFDYSPIPSVPPAVNALGQLIGQQQRNVVSSGGDQSNPGFSSDDQVAFDSSNRLQTIVSQVTGGSTFTNGVAAIKTLPASTQALILADYSKPIDPTWAQTGVIGKGTTDAGQAVEQEIATALTNAVQAAL